MKPLFSAISGILMIIGFVPYILAIRRGETKPAKASWIIWAVLDTITFAGMFVEGAVNGQILAAVIGVWAIVAHALKYGVPGWTNLDKFCLAGAVTGITLWAMFDSPLLGVVTSVSVVSIGSIPTFVNAWNNPANEDRLAWTIFWISCVFVFLAIPGLSWNNVLHPITLFTDLSLIDVMQPASFFTIESIMMYLLYVRARKFYIRNDI